MSKVKCGNCHEYHDDIAAVRACYFPNGAPNPSNYQVSAVPNRTADQPYRKASSQRSWVSEPVRSAAPASNLWQAGVLPPLEGRYTVVLASGERRTLRFKKGTGNWQGKVIISYLAGPDNDSDYQGFADCWGKTVRVWRRFKTESTLIECMQYLLGNEEARLAAGEAYALESSRCYRCNRTLTVPSSIHRGLGPECAQIVSI